MVSSSGVTGVILAGGKSKRFGFNKIEIKIGKIPLLISQIFKLSYFCDEILICTNQENYSIVRREVKNIHRYQKFLSSLTKKKMPPIKIFLDEIELKDLNLLEGFNSPGGIGPIGAIYIGLKNAKNFYSIIVPVDMPLISYNLLKLLTGHVIGYGGGEEANKNTRDSSSRAISDFSEDFTNADNAEFIIRFANGVTDNIANKPVDIAVVRTRKGFEAICGIYSKECLEALRENIKKKIYKISEIFPRLNTKIFLEDEIKQAGIDSFDFLNINTIEDYKHFREIWERGVLSNGSFNISSGFCKKWENFFYRKDSGRT